MLNNKFDTWHSKTDFYMFNTCIKSAVGLLKRMDSEQPLTIDNTTISADVRPHPLS